MSRDGEPTEYDVLKDPRYLALEGYFRRSFSDMDAHYWAREFTTFLGKEQNWRVGIDSKGEELRLFVSQERPFSLTLDGKRMVISAEPVTWFGHLSKCEPDELNGVFLLRTHEGDCIYLERPAGIIVLINPPTRIRREGVI